MNETTLSPANARQITPDEARQFEDLQWAQQDPSVRARYRGCFVVPYKKQIVASGHDMERVLADAVQATQRPVEELPVIGINDPLQDISAD
jgi:hypothetical protein